jgi:hypothetical protein
LRWLPVASDERLRAAEQALVRLELAGEIAGGPKTPTAFSAHVRARHNP